MLRALVFLSAMVYTTYGFSRNAINLGLVSEKYPVEFWDTLANMTDADLSPPFLRIVLRLDRTRAGDE